jgi:Zn-dependent peptidase ImmA (M78 family)
MVDEIINRAKELRKGMYGIDVISLINSLKIDLNYISLKPSIYKGYVTNIFGNPIININKLLPKKHQNIIAAHELGHALFHQDNCYNSFNGDDFKQEYEADLFAVALLFDEKDLDVKFKDLTSYELKSILEFNLK